MIILFSNKCNNFDQILLKYHNLINLPYIKCPYCNSCNIIKWGFYKRNIYYVSNNNIIYNNIKIQRVKCKSCNHTHALIPSYVVPYKQYLLDSILYYISNDDIIHKNSYSLDSIKNWKYQFNKFVPYLKTMLSNIKEEEIIVKLKNNINYFYEQFFLANKKILMMFHPNIFNTAYF